MCKKFLLSTFFYDSELILVSRDDMDDSDLYELNPHNEEEYVLPDEDDKGSTKHACLIIVDSITYMI